MGIAARTKESENQKIFERVMMPEMRNSITKWGFAAARVAELTDRSVAFAKKSTYYYFEKKII